MVRVLALVARRRIDVPAGARPIGYGQALRPMMTVVAVLSLLETIAAAIIVGRLVHSAALRWVLLALSAYACCWVMSFRSALLRRPHFTTDDGLCLRFATLWDVVVPLACTARVVSDRASGFRRTAMVTEGTLAVSVMGATNLLITLTKPQTVILGSESHQILAIRFFADDPSAAVRQLSTFTNAPRPSP